MSYLLQADYYDTLPTSASNPLISFQVSASSSIEELSLGQSHTQTIAVTNIAEAQGMAVAILSVPSCMSIDMNQLSILKDKGSIDQFEVSSDKTLITLYWTYLKDGAKKEVQLSRTRAFAGKTCKSRAN